MLRTLPAIPAPQTKRRAVIQHQACRFQYGIGESDRIERMGLPESGGHARCLTGQAIILTRARILKYNEFTRVDDLLSPLSTRVEYALEPFLGRL